MNSITDYIKDKKIITDGAFGTYYSEKYDTMELPELANIQYPDRVVTIHKEYIEAGAGLIRTNTFASNFLNLDCDIEDVKENISAAVKCARRAVAESKKDVYIAADLGPVPNDNMFNKELVISQYVESVKCFLDMGINIFVFETFSDLSEINEAIEIIGDNGYIITQFAINQFGYSSTGLSAAKLVECADKNQYIDVVGFNCGIGPGHMEQIIKSVRKNTAKRFSGIPNAGYPEVLSGRMVFSNKNADYFADKICDIASAGADLVGGCCGTTPNYIKSISEKMNITQSESTYISNKETTSKNSIINNAFYQNKEGKMLIAVELAPPMDSNAEKLMSAARYLVDKNVDVLTFPDSPSGRTRADSLLMAEKVSRETGMCVMPHLCCRDKNAIAMRAQLLGAHINGINNFLVVTGDPIPSVVRNSVKSVFNFDSVGLMNIIDDMNKEQFDECSMVYGGAINQGRPNLDVEIQRVKKKMEAGATFFLTQPVFSHADADRLRTIKEETGARILCGIMPLVSLKNATFMKNEMTGINVTDEIISRYRKDMTKKEGEQTGISIAREIIEKTKDFVDGYYFSFPFNRVYMIEPILENMVD
ncbi:MAG: bifunctional homocysteine S-methyltransferase/methylenetetrahydrofolate reductase [Eubacteriales bacterium]|nr:bifunctional homocysteine S-methyltransferase/methylenetetrahydrofolate reductase [Eubacteriales bacterium]